MTIQHVRHDPEVSQIDMRRCYLHPWGTSSCTHTLDRSSANAFSLAAAEDFHSTMGVNNIFSNQFKISGFCRPGSHRMSFTEPIYIGLFFWLFVHDIKQVPIHFSCSGERCKTVLLRCSRKVLWTVKLHLTFHQLNNENSSFGRTVPLSLVPVHWLRLWDPTESGPWITSKRPAFRCRSLSFFFTFPLSFTAVEP